MYSVTRTDELITLSSIDGIIEVFDVDNDFYILDTAESLCREYDFTFSPKLLMKNGSSAAVRR